MRIALVVPGFSAHEQDWAIPALQTLATRLSRRHDLHVFSLRYPSRPVKQFGGFTHHATGGGQRYRLASLGIWWRTLQAIRGVHAQRPFDLLHAFWADEPGLVAVLAGRFLRRPVVVSAAGGELTYLPEIRYGTSGSRFRRAVVRAALNGAGQVTAGSRYQLDLIHPLGVPKARVHLVPLGIDTEQFAPPVAPPPAPLTLVQAASLTAVKQPGLLVQVLRQVREQIPDARLKVAGAGPQQQALEETARRTGLAHAVCWLGEQMHPAMPGVYQAAHFYVQTSLHEAQGMSVLEALACGVPVVGTPVGILNEVAWAPPSWEADRIAFQIVKLWRDPEQYVRFRGEARAMALARFRWEVVEEALEEVYRYAQAGGCQ